MGSERRIRFESHIYLDCTGDGLVGFLAGAKYRIGREAKDEYNEEWAPEVADDITLGSTLLFYTKDAGHPVSYIPPSFAKDITQTTIPMHRVIRSGDSGCHYWWIEWGGEHDTVHDNERIRDELWSVIYGIWDYIKNSGKFDADTYDAGMGRLDSRQKGVPPFHRRLRAQPERYYRQRRIRGRRCLRRLVHRPASAARHVFGGKRFEAYACGRHLSCSVPLVCIP